MGEDADDREGVRVVGSGRMHPKDLEALIIAMHEGIPPYTNPGALTVGGDVANILRDVVRTEIGRHEHGEGERIPRFVRDECKTVIDEALRPILKSIERFVTSEEIDARIKKGVEEGFESIGLLIDKDHREETGSRVRGIMEWQKVVDQAWRTLRSAAAVGILYGLFKLAGINIPPWLFGSH